MDKHEKKRTKNKMAENHQRNGVRDPDRRRNRTCICYAVSEFGTYEYDKKSIEKGKEVPVKEDDHCMDAIRYCVMGAWKRLKYWLPKDETEEIDVCDISRKEVEDDEYL